MRTDRVAHALATVCFSVAMFIAAGTVQSKRLELFGIGTTICLTGFGVAFARRS